MVAPKEPGHGKSRQRLAEIGEGQSHVSGLMDSQRFLLVVEKAPKLLIAISIGAVFMGANTYIGNGPNFMVKAIAEENGVAMPSFFGYMKYSMLILVPLFVLVTLVFLL